MSPVLRALLALVVALFRSRRAMQLETLALRHQVAVYQQTVSRPRLRPTDRLFWAWLSRLWPRWQDALMFVQFLHNHVKDLVACDFFTVPTVTFRVLFVFVILAHDRRRLVHFHVTEHPTAHSVADR